jgi:hypothetical protein
MFDEMTLKSPDGGYYYHAAETHGCTNWIADITLASYSNAQTNPQGVRLGPRAVVITPKACNLPSSAAFGGTKPIVIADCEMYRLYVRTFKKAFGETKFKLSVWGEFEGLWKAGDVSGLTQLKGEGIQLGTSDSFSAYFTINDPDIGVDVHRVAVTVILRDSAQRVQVHIGQPPQN